MDDKLRESIIEGMWSDLGRIGLKRSDFDGNLKQIGLKSECRCVVWFQHKTEYDEFCPILDHETLGEGHPIYLAVLFKNVTYFRPSHDNDWDFPISTHDCAEITTEDFVAEACGEKFEIEIDGIMRTIA